MAVVAHTVLCHVLYVVQSVNNHNHWFCVPYHAGIIVLIPSTHVSHVTHRSVATSRTSEGKNKPAHTLIETFHEFERQLQYIPGEEIL